MLLPLWKLFEILHPNMDTTLAGVLASLDKFRKKREDGTSTTYVVEEMAKVSCGTTPRPYACDSDPKTHSKGI